MFPVPYIPGTLGLVPWGAQQSAREWGMLNAGEIDDACTETARVNSASPALSIQLSQKLPWVNYWLNKTNVCRRPSQY